MGRTIKDAAQEFFGGSIPEVSRQSYQGGGGYTTPAASGASSAIQEAAARWERRNELDEFERKWRDDQAELQRKREEEYALREKAQGSVMAYDESGRLSPWQTALNLASDAKSFNQAAQDAKSKEEKQREAEEREKYLRPKTAEEAKEVYGLGYDLKQSKFLSWLLGHPVYTPAKGVSIGEIHGAEKGASASEVASAIKKNLSGQAQTVKKNVQSTAQQIASGEGRKTGNETLDNWGANMRQNAQAARQLGERGVSTYSIPGSLTQRTADEYTQRYADMSYGEKLGHNIPLTAANYLLDIANAGITSADALSGGKLGSGSSKASSIFKLANFAQNAGSGLTREAYNSMRESTNWLGGLVLDLERTTVEQLLDRAAGSGSLAVMGVRVFGSGAQEAEDRGEGLMQQIKTAGARGAVEIGTELLGGVGGSWRGTGYGDAFLGKLDKWVASKTGSELLGTLANAFTGEALEEMIADVLNPIMDRILGIGEATGRGEDKPFMQKLGDFLTDVWGNGQLLYDGLLGGLAGLGGGAVTQAGYSITAKNLAVDVATYKAAQRIVTNDALKAKFEELTGQKLSTDEQDALLQTALYLVNVSETTEGNPNARQVETDLMRGTADKQSASFAVAGVSANQLQSNVKAAFTESGLEISGREAKMLSDAYIPQVSGEDRFIYGMREAYQYGAKGFTLAQTFANAEFAKDLAPTQVRLAWTLGGGIQTVKSGSVDTKTTEGKERALAELGALGKHAEAALKAYDGEADISGYAGAMNKAAALYAASGADLKAIVQAARNGEAQDIVGSLTDAQVETAMKIGAEIRAERQAAVKASAARIREIKAQASGAQALAETNKALTEARAFAKSEQAEADRLQKEADDLIAADEVPDNAEEIWNRATEAAREHRKNADTARETVKELEAKRQQLQSIEPGKRKKGTVSFDGVDQAQLSRKQKNVVAMVQALADAVNIDYVIFSGDARGNQGAYRNGTVYLNINAGEAGNKVLAAATLSHELTHYMQQYAPEEYAELKDFIVREILKKDAKQFAALVTRQTNLEPGLSYDQAEDEVIANACQTMLLDSKAIAKLARQNMSLAEKIADVIEDITAKIKAAFEDVSMESIGFRDAVKAVEGELEQIQALWDKGIEAATENYNAAQTVRGQAENKQEPASKQTENAAGVQYQKRDDGQTKSIKQQIQAHAAELNRKPVVSSVRVSDMPTKDIQKQRRWIEARLRNTGYAVDRKGLGRIEFTPSQINTGLNYLDEPGEIAAFATLPAVLKRGDIIDRHEGHKGRQRGSVTIAAPVEINGVRGNMAVALTQTGKTHYHAHRIVMPDGSTFIFANENDAEPKPAGELPAKQALIAEPISSTSDINIADASGKSKAKFQKIDNEGKALTERQADFFTDSKIRDANGRLKVMYRGGDGDFTVFDRRMASYSNLYGRGFYFTESKEHAQQYGRARAFYLNITSPLQAGSKTFTRQQIRSYLEAVAENEDYGLDNYGREATVDSVLRSLWGKDDFGILTDINASCIGDMVAAVELFNEINGTSIDGIVVPTETVAFRPEQIKLTDNANPTEHEDVRYQMWDDSPVENVSDKLVAVHNVSEEKLLGALKLGGLPMPSIAIVKAKTGHSMYGPISLVFGKDSIDPRADRRNKVYGSDAWTPTGVRIDYQLDSGKLGDFEDRLHELSQKVAGGVFSSASAIRAESIDTTTTHDLESAVEKLAKNETVLAAYAAEHGIDIPPVYQVKTYSSYGNETLQTYIDRIGTEKLAQLHEQFMSGAWDVSPGDMAEIKAVLVEKFMSQKGFNSKPVTQERAEKRASLVEKDDRAIKFIEDAYRMQTDENKTGEEVDRWRTLDAMKERLSNADVKGWVREAMSGVYQGSGIYNGKESYYPDGRRRTFKQTHDAVTLGNIVKNMSRNQEAKGQGAHFGATGIQSITSQDFQSVEEMRQASGRLARLSEEEYSAAVKAVDEKLENLVNDIADSNKDNTYLAREIVREAILETARGRRTVAAIQKFFGEETEYRISAEQAETLIGLFHEAANLPTEYFEAKPQRAVGFDEVRAAVIPDNSTDGLRNALSSAGVPTVEYTAGDEDARLRAVQSVPETQFQRWDDGQSEKWAEMREEIEAGDVKGPARVKTPALFFQKWDDTTDDTAAERNGRELAYTRLQSENKILSDTIKALNKVISKKDNTIEKLQTRLHLTKTQEVRTSDARKLARTLLRENSSSADVAEITAKIKALGDYIVQSDTVTEEEVKSRARSIAAEILEQASEQVEMEDEQLAAIRDSIKGRKLTISPDFFGELDGGFDTFRKGLFGKFTLARADSTSIDRSEYTSVSQFYADMQSEYGQAYFPDAANEGEEATILANVMQAASPMEVNPYEQYMGEATEELANRIAMNALGGVLRVNPPTDADRAKARRVELQQHILQLKKEQKIADREAGSLYQTIYDLSIALDQAESRYKSLRIAGDQRVEQVRTEGAARALEIKAKERAKAVENIADLKEHYKEIQRNARERRENTGKRHKIRRLIDELNARLKNPTEKRHIPRELVQQTIDVLSMIDLDNGRSVSLTEKLAAIRTMYEGYQNDPTYSIVYDDVTAEMLKNLAATVGNTKLLNMSQAQLDAVYDTLKSLNHVIHDSINVKIGNEERSAYELSREMTEETRQISKAQRGWVKGKYLPAHLRADVAFRRFAGFKKNSAWEAMCRVLNDGQLRQTELKMQLCIPFAELVQDEKGISDFTGVNKFGKIDKSKLVDIGLKDENGDAILVTHDIMTGIYLDLLNEDNRRHFIRGGKTIPNLQEFYDGKGGFGIGARRAVGISEQLSDLYGERREAESANYGDWSEDAQARIDELESEGEKYAREVKAAIEKNMTDFDRQWVKATQRLMDTDSKRLLNEVTMEVYGIKKARVEHYFPITTDPNFLRGTSFDSITRNMSLENAGFMKERVPASNPTLALGVAGVVNNQINRVSQYCGLMPAIRNFNKVYNKVGAGYSDSLRNAVNGVFGKEGLRYIENLIADLTGSRAAKDDVMGLSKILGVLRGNLAQSTLTLNPRVALAQAASYPTAAAELGYGPLAKAFFSGGKSGRMISRADTELIAKYSPLLWYRMQGYSSPELGDIKSSDRLSSKVFKKLRWFTGWIQAVDGATVGRLWYASEYWVQDHKPALQKGTDAYYEAVAEKFNAVVEKTQPNYTPMQRAAILREPDNLIRTLTMFMTQRLQNFNILYDSTAAYQKARADFASKRNGVTQADVKEAKTQMVNAVTSQFAQAAVFTAFKFFADALLHRLDDYRDDETGEITAESVSLRLLNNYVDAFIGAFLLGSELYGIIKGITGLDKWYGLSLSGVDSINDIIDSTVKLAGGNYDMSTEEGRNKFGKALWKLVKNLSTGLGIPTTNAEKMYNAVRYHVEDMANGEALSFEAGFDRTTEQRAEKLILALESGDMAAIQETAGVFDSEKSAVAAIKKKLSKDVKAGTRSAEDAQRILVLAGQSEDAAYWATLGMEGEDKYTEIKAAVLAGDKDAVKSEREQLTSHGVKDSSIESAVKGFLRKAFLGLELSEKEAEILGDTKITATDAEKMLTQFLGVDRADAADLVDGWKFEQANGYSYGDRKEKYIDGEISASELKKALMSQGGKTAEEADKIISGYDFEKRHGWSWDDRKRIYQKGKVSSADMSRLLMEREGMTAQQAAAQLQVWDWAKEIDGAENITVSAIEKYNTYCAGAGVSKESFVYAWTMYNDTHADVDASGEAIKNSKMKKVFQQIAAMPISAAQKSALALGLGYAQSSVNKYRVW